MFALLLRLGGGPPGRFLTPASPGFVAPCAEHGALEPRPLRLPLPHKTHTSAPATASSPSSALGELGDLGAYMGMTQDSGQQCRFQ